MTNLDQFLENLATLDKEFPNAAGDLTTSRALLFAAIELLPPETMKAMIENAKRRLA